jgi:hypothetical protein
MNLSVLETLEDMLWCRDTHNIEIYFTVKGIKQRAAMIILLGNDDSPQEIKVYHRDHYRSVPTIYIADENGKMTITQKGKITLRPKTKKERETGCL